MNHRKNANDLDRAHTDQGHASIMQIANHSLGAY